MKTDFLNPQLDSRLDTPAKRERVAARLDERRWQPRNAEEESRREYVRQQVLAGQMYIPTRAEAAAQEEAFLDYLSCV